ncbi:MAG TPA: 4Fe-4S binding protein [Candidatus Omnitrophota bacterium]|nr:4Fe-4S binding protein [Candidatus Omnitrophota bacterium]
MGNEKVTIKIDSEKCKGCLLCVKVCPRGVIRQADGVNSSGQRYVVVDDPEKCVGCGLCFIMCPDCAIEIEKLTQ